MLELTENSGQIYGTKSEPARGADRRATMLIVIAGLGLPVAVGITFAQWYGAWQATWALAIGYLLLAAAYTLVVKLRVQKEPPRPGEFGDRACAVHDLATGSSDAFAKRDSFSFAPAARAGDRFEALPVSPRASGSDPRLALAATAAWARELMEMAPLTIAASALGVGIVLGLTVPQSEGERRGLSTFLTRSWKKVSDALYEQSLAPEELDDNVVELDSSPATRGANGVPQPRRMRRRKSRVGRISPSPESLASQDAFGA